ncbi:MAG: AtzH-like domain-containing protein [Planctomycetota bacterium]|jgi:ketosteroid isomerase-like protein
MNADVLKEIDDCLRSMRQAYNSRDLKAFRAHFWTDKRFVNLDASGRIDVGWGAYEEILDGEFRYMDKVTLELRDLQITPIDFGCATATAIWRLAQIDPDGRSAEQSGRASFTFARLRDEWKIVQQHFSADLQDA